MNNPVGNATDATLLQPGHQYTINGLMNSNISVSCQCTHVDQRNWSRVGFGQIITEDGKTEQVFLKQNIRKNGKILSDHWEYEKLGATVAMELFHNIVSIPQLKYHNPALALSVFEFIDVIPFDTLLRHNSSLFTKCFTDFLEHSSQILQTMQSGKPGTIVDALPTKQRSYGSPSTSINFKGFDIRNIGIINEPKNNIDCSEFIMFDFGRPYKAPIEEAAAKLFISIGLLNWGRPISRFSKGPDTDILTMALPYMKSYLDPESINAELELQSKFRSSEIHGLGIFERSLKKLGIDLLGKQYLKKLGQWCTDNIST
jgi:hypothetical protein